MKVLFPDFGFAGVSDARSNPMGVFDLAGTEPRGQRGCTSWVPAQRGDRMWMDRDGSADLLAFILKLAQCPGTWLPMCVGHARVGLMEVAVHDNTLTDWGKSACRSSDVSVVRRPEEPSDRVLAIYGDNDRPCVNTAGNLWIWRKLWNRAPVRLPAPV